MAGTLASSVGSEGDSSAGPSTTPSAATAVLTPPATTAATGERSTTWICSPCGKLATACTSRTTPNGATAARSAAGRRLSVLMCRAAPRSAASMDGASGPCTPVMLTRSTATSDELRSHSQPPPSGGSAIRTASRAIRVRRCEDRNARARRQAASAKPRPGALCRAAIAVRSLPARTPRARGARRRAGVRRGRATAPIGGTRPAGLGRPAAERSIQMLLRPLRANPYSLSARAEAPRRVSAPPARARRRSAPAHVAGPRPSRRRRPPSWPARCSR